MQNLSQKEILEHLDEVKRSLENDVGSIINVYIKKGDSGFFAILRLIFPEIDHLGSLYKGVNNQNEIASAAIEFMKTYFARVNPEYSNKAAFIYIIYRHGLIHSHSPKTMLYDKQLETGWRISMDGKQHLYYDGYRLSIDGPTFYNDFLKAISFYREDISNEKEGLARNFNIGFQYMLAHLNKGEMLKRKYCSLDDFAFLNQL